MLTAERLRQVLNYDPETGVFTWRKNSGRRGGSGRVAGCLNNEGYCRIGVDGASYRAHRLAWLYVYGVFPVGEIDHRDQNKANNRITNLRDATHSQNRQNVPIRSSNKSGYRGVHWDANSKRWKAQIGINKRRLHLGLFQTPEEAYEAYLSAARNFHTHNPLNFQQQKVAP